MSQLFRPGDEVIWWKRASGEFVFPVAARVLSATAKRIRIEADDPESESGAIVRYVTANSLQRRGLSYLKDSGQRSNTLEPVRSWGIFTRYLEVGEDLYALRSVDAFENGNYLRYDRSHWVDDFGMLGDARFRRQKWETWWGPAAEIECAEFEEVWRSAGESPIWNLQKASARMSEWGETPPWLHGDD